MRALIQRVSQASVSIEERITGQISYGLLVFLGVESADSLEDIDWLIKKITQLRIFSDAEGKMNESVLDQEGGLLVVSQFTLHANIKKGTRPSFIKAAPPEQAKALYDQFIDRLQVQVKTKIACGEFGANMQVQLINDGPVTIWLDS